MFLTATYSPDDNKLRLYASSRLDKETYERVKAAGFKWAPKQDLFVAPMWTPAREDLLIELCGEIGDEDKSLVERAEERSERFEEYSDKRRDDAHAAHAVVAAVADNIPFGQPILVGHHSERHARRDAERIQNGMRKAVKLWETSKYWERRAAGAIHHAKYKERPDVRARRIKGLETEARKCQRNKDAAVAIIKVWSTLHDDAATTIKKKDGSATTFRERAVFVAGNTNTTPFGVWSGLSDGKMTPEEAQRQTLEAAQRSLDHAERWLTHINNRLAYERAMLADAGGTVAQRSGPEVGGGVKCWASPRGGWSYVKKVNKVSVTVEDNWGNGGKNFTRTMPFDKLAAVMSKADVDAARADGRIVDSADKSGFFLTDEPERKVRSKTDDPDAAKFDALRYAAKAGVQIAVSPSLFPTPPDVAARMVDLLNVRSGLRVLEPSAGTGNLVKAVRDAGVGVLWTVVERDSNLSNRLRVVLELDDVRNADFLLCGVNGETQAGGAELGKFDRVVMNPSFDNGEDIKHILHAYTFLKPGGRLVALCANGPRQQKALKHLSSTWEELPAGTFEGTGVRAAMILIKA